MRKSRSQKDYFLQNEGRSTTKGPKGEMLKRSPLRPNFPNTEKKMDTGEGLWLIDDEVPALMVSEVSAKQLRRRWVGWGRTTVNAC